MANVPTSAALRSPFTGHASGNRPNAAGQTGVHLRAAILPSVTLISTWISGIAGLMEALATVFGGQVPAQSGKTCRTPQGLLARTGPEEFLLIGDQGGTADRCALLRASVRPDVGSVTDLSHARCVIHIEGPECRAVLGKLFALDLRESAFAVGDVALTGTHHVPSLLHRQGVDAFDLLVFSTYAYDQLGTVLDAALEYGVTLDPL